MADQYLTIATIAHDAHMIYRVSACAAQQHAPIDPQSWAAQNSYAWAASPTWAEKWDSAVASDIAEPGADPAVITDGDILATVQGLLTPAPPTG
jgi:hypothetical protein